MIETREVLGGAYPQKHKGAMLTHAVEVDADGREVRVLCRRVQLDSIADAGSMSRGGKSQVPTCTTCRRRDPRFP